MKTPRNDVTKAARPAVSHASVIIHYDHFVSPLGSLVMAATEQGLCALFFTGGRNSAAVDEKALEHALRRHLPTELRRLDPQPRRRRRRTFANAGSGIADVAASGTADVAGSGIADVAASGTADVAGSGTEGIILRSSHHRLTPVRRWLERYFAGEPVGPSDLEMPLDLRGTPFQKKVWKQLTRIPYGKTASYGEIARRIDVPHSARAVGMANHNNPVTVIVPCHRVIGSNGKLVGYGAGLWRKKALLRLEKDALEGKSR